MSLQGFSSISELRKEQINKLEDRNHETNREKKKRMKKTSKHTTTHIMKVPNGEERKKTDEKTMYIKKLNKLYVDKCKVIHTRTFCSKNIGSQK